MVLIVDDLLLGAFRFVLQRLADAVNMELNDDKVYREELLATRRRMFYREVRDLTLAAAGPSRGLVTAPGIAR